MMSFLDFATGVLLVIGMLFYLAGTVGLLRFPDLFTRLHAISKADNVGLGMLVLGLLLQADSWITALKYLIAWWLMLLASASSCHLIAQAALRAQILPWRREP